MAIGMHAKAGVGPDALSPIGPGWRPGGGGGRASELAAYRAGPLAPPYMRRVWQAAACQTPPPPPGAIPAQASSAIPKTYECLK